LGTNLPFFYLETWEKNYDPEKNKGNFYWDRYLVILSGNCAVGSVCSIMHYFLFPNTVYPNAMLPQSCQDSTIVYLLIGAVISYALFSMWHLIILNTIALEAYPLFIIPVMSTEFMSNRSDYKTCEALREPKNLMHEYRSMEIFAKSLVNCYGILVIPIQCLTTICIILLNCTVISQWDKLDVVTMYLFVVLSFTNQIVMSIALSFGGLVNNHGKATLKSWKAFDFHSKKEYKCVCKFQKSCKPLKCGMEGYYTVQSVTVLNFHKGITKGTVRALLTLKDN